jgi:magnesium-transporting ATPase (P-type)
MIERRSNFPEVGFWLTFLVLCYVGRIVTAIIMGMTTGSGNFAIDTMMHWFVFYTVAVAGSFGYAITRFAVPANLRLYLCGFICGIVALALYVPFTGDFHRHPDAYYMTLVMVFLNWTVVGTFAWFTTQNLFEFLQERRA